MGKAKLLILSHFLLSWIVSLLNASDECYLFPRQFDLYREFFWIDWSLETGRVARLLQGIDRENKSLHCKKWKAHFHCRRLHILLAVAHCFASVSIILVNFFEHLFSFSVYFTNNIKCRAKDLWIFEALFIATKDYQLNLPRGVRIKFVSIV